MSHREAANGTSAVSYSYNEDEMLPAAGDLSVSRASATGLSFATV